MARKQEAVGQDWAARAGLALMKLDRDVDMGGPEDIVITRITIKTPGEGRVDWMAVIKATYNGANIVSFHNADSLVELIAGISNRMGNGSLNWREDKAWNENRK